MTDASASEALPPGTILGGSYRVTRLLGEGGMGSVYEAYHAGAGKRVAVKVMHRGLLAYPELSARFRREAKVTSELNHPHVVKVFDLGFGPAGEPYLVMEFLEGEDLHTRIEREGPLPVGTVVQIVNQIASALAEAHAASVVHRDLKPDNIFLVRAPDAPVFAKVVDFGVSKVLKVSATKLTVAQAIIGTPEFMAPEQAEARHDQIDHRTDQWSLACVAWVALTGCLPFWGPDANATLNQVISAVPTAPRAGAPAIPPAVETVLRRALSKKSFDRFPTIRAFARYFEGAASQAQAPAKPAPAAGMPVPAAAANRPANPPRQAAGVVLAVAVTLAIVASGGWFLRDWPPIATYVRRAAALVQPR